MNKSRWPEIGSGFLSDVVVSSEWEKNVTVTVNASKSKPNKFYHLRADPELFPITMNGSFDMEALSVLDVILIQV